MSNVYVHTEERLCNPQFPHVWLSPAAPVILNFLKSDSTTSCTEATPRTLFNPCACWAHAAHTHIFYWPFSPQWVMWAVSHQLSSLLQYLFPGTKLRLNWTGSIRHLFFFLQFYSGAKWSSWSADTPNQLPKHYMTSPQLPKHYMTSPRLPKYQRDH